jgi:hypothetical protein
MKFTEQQVRMWNDMIDSVECYRRGKGSFRDFVGGVNLSGIWYAGDFKDEELYKEWVRFWGPLEEWNALQQDGQEIPMDKVERDVSQMEAFLKKTIEPYLHEEEH